MPYAKIGYSGERYGLVKVRLDMFLSPDDARYNDLRFYQIDPNSREYLKGYKGKLDDEGTPVDFEEYKVWESSLPRIWLPERKFHNHFLTFEPDALTNEDPILAGIEHHLPNFYKAWTEEYDKLEGGMRKGWDVETRWRAVGRPRRYNKEMTPTEYEARKLACLEKVQLIKASNLSDFTTRDGETFPSTDIDVGAAAIDRTSAATIHSYTYVDLTNPANYTGALDYWEAWFNIAVGSDVWIGTFSADGNDLTVRDSESVGAVSTGSKQSGSGIDIDIESGDYIGSHSKSGSCQIERDSSGGSTGYWYLTSECIDPSDSATFNYVGTAKDISLYGTGETAAAGLGIPLAMHHYKMLSGSN